VEIMKEAVTHPSLTGVVYERPDSRFPPLRVNRLQADEVTTAFSVAAQSLLQLAYQTAYEGPAPRLAPRSIKRFLFDPRDDTKVAAYKERVVNHIASGSEYWLLWSTPEPTGLALAHGAELEAVAKVTPSRETIIQKANLRPPNAFINDVAVQPHRQHRRLASVVLHAALSFSDYQYQDNATFLLDAFDDNMMTKQWITRLELASQGPISPRLVGSDERLAQTRYKSTVATVGTLRAKLLLALQQRGIASPKRIIASSLTE
jgi:hypothetical protein